MKNIFKNPSYFIYIFIHFFKNIFGMNILESQGCFLPSLVEINVEVVSGKEQFRRKSSTIQRPGFIFLSGKLILTSAHVNMPLRHWSSYYKYITRADLEGVRTHTPLDNSNFWIRACHMTDVNLYHLVFLSTYIT